MLLLVLLRMYILQLFIPELIDIVLDTVNEEIEVRLIKLMLGVFIFD